MAKNTSLKDNGRALLMRALTHLKMMTAFVGLVICCQSVVDGPLGISSAYAQESVTITCDRPTKEELFPTWTQAERDAIPGPGLDESAYAQIDAKIEAMYENQNLFGQSIYQETFFVSDLKEWLRGDRQPFSQEVLKRNQKMKLLLAQMKILENNRSTFDIVGNIDAGIDYIYLSKLKRKFGWTGLADEIDSNYQYGATTRVSTGMLNIIKSVTDKLRTIKVEDCASRVSDQIAPPNPITCDPLTKEDLEKALSLTAGYFDPVPGPGLDDNAYTAFNHKVMALYNDTSKIEYGAMPLLLQRWPRYQGTGSKEEYENNQKIRLVLAQKKVLEENKYFFDVQNWLTADRRPAVLPNRMGEPNLSDFLHEYFNDPTYQFEKQKYPDTLYKVGKIVAKLEAVEGKLVPCPTPVADTSKTAESGTADPELAPVAADPLKNSALSAASGGDYKPNMSTPESKSTPTMTGLSGKPIKTTCDPLTKTELLEGFPLINVFFIINPKGKAAWDKIPEINQPEAAYAEIDKQIDDLANLAFSAINEADDVSSQTVTVGGAPTSPPSTTLSKPVVEQATVQKAFNINVSQLGGMKTTQIIKQLVRGKLAPDQNQTIRVMLAQLQVLFSDKNINAMNEIKATIPETVDQTELFKELGQGIPDNTFDNAGHAFGTTDLAQNLQPLIDEAKKNLPNLSVSLDIDKVNAFINGVIADVQAVKPMPCTGGDASAKTVLIPCGPVTTAEIQPMFTPKKVTLTIKRPGPATETDVATFKNQLNTLFDGEVTKTTTGGVTATQISSRMPQGSTFYNRLSNWSNNSLDTQGHQLLRYTLAQITVMSNSPLYNAVNQAYRKMNEPNQPTTGSVEQQYDATWKPFYDNILGTLGNPPTGDDALVTLLKSPNFQAQLSDADKANLTTLIAELKALKLAPNCPAITPPPSPPPPPKPAVVTPPHPPKPAVVTPPPAPKPTVTPPAPKPAPKPTVTPPAPKPAPKPTVTPPAPKPAPKPAVSSACPMMKREDIFTALGTTIQATNPPKMGSPESAYAAFDKNIDTPYNRNNSKAGTSHYNLLKKAARGTPLTPAENKALSQTLLNTLEGSARKAPLPAVHEAIRQSLKGCK